MSTIDISAAVATFLVEGRELAEELERGLLKLDEGHDRNDPELINALFRAAHTIKGSAGIVGIDSLGRFTHRVESLLDRVRSGEPLLDDAMITQLLRCCDHINKLLDLAAAGDVEGRDLAAVEGELLAGLDRSGTGAHSAVESPSNSGATPPSSGQGNDFRLLALFGDDCLRHGMDPASALLYLASLARIDDTMVLGQLVPALDRLDAETCHLAIAIRGHCERLAVIDEAFEFFREGSCLLLISDHDTPAQTHERLQRLRQRASDEQLQPWRQAGFIQDTEWNAPQSPATAEARPASRGVEGTPGAEAAAPRGEPTSAPAAAAAAPARFVRVPAPRLDELIQQVGELVIAGAGVDVLSRDTRNGRLQEAVESLMKLIDSIQSGALQLRMVPIGETFSRFQRVVRDVSRDLGKNIHLDIVGGDTELDKSMVERIGDPLMHLVRNAMDHGLETPTERVAAGKPEQGTLRLRAFHDSGNVVVEVSDDGRGLNTERIVAKAIERGIVSSAEGMNDHDIHQLIFEPGFSTAEQVTSLSGRGVGMDVVKRSIESLRGAITLNSRPGEGTLMQLRLPLTLAIIDGFMVGVDAARFILPLDMVVECIELPDGAMLPERPKYLNLRGEVLPYICLRETFSIDAPMVRRPSVVVVRSGGTKTGLLVDSLHGEIQTVIKPMTGIFRHLRSICGTSILGTGDIALILDVHQLVQGSVERATRPTVNVPTNP